MRGRDSEAVGFKEERVEKSKGLLERGGRERSCRLSVNRRQRKRKRERVCRSSGKRRELGREAIGHL